MSVETAVREVEKKMTLPPSGMWGAAAYIPLVLGNKGLFLGGGRGVG